MPAEIPAGGTWFDTLKRSFDDVPVDAANDNAIATSEFLEAAESLTTLFDVLGSAAFSPVKSDLTGNIKVRLSPRSGVAPSNTKKHVATEGLVWLVRGLEFTAKALRHNLDNGTELSDSFRDAYGKTLKQHHSFMIKPIFSAAMSATPYRKDFYAKLGSDEGKVKAALEREVAALEKRVEILKSFQERKEAKW
ncbi:hypothetical protein AN3147.2 [Aspergillus nidulans FGSC A4]|nr:hypothetical protein AN3147.2 [Aspergillus nidulans FGSC A4]|eukprot:XP_660751.1 hypothetical protein AN3147.2 [Aspergillus nidulans FGSC A4]